MAFGGAPVDLAITEELETHRVAIDRVIPRLTAGEEVWMATMLIPRTVTDMLPVVAMLLTTVVLGHGFSNEKNWVVLTVSTTCKVIESLCSGRSPAGSFRRTVDSETQRLPTTLVSPTAAMLEGSKRPLAAPATVMEEEPVVPILVRTELDDRETSVLRARVREVTLEPVTTMEMEDRTDTIARASKHESEIQEEDSERDRPTRHVVVTVEIPVSMEEPTMVRLWPPVPAKFDAVAEEKEVTSNENALVNVKIAARFCEMTRGGRATTALAGFTKIALSEFHCVAEAAVVKMRILLDCESAAEECDEPPAVKIVTVADPVQGVFDRTTADSATVSVDSDAERVRTDRPEDAVIPIINCNLLAAVAEHFLTERHE